MGKLIYQRDKFDQHTHGQAFFYARNRNPSMQYVVMEGQKGQKHMNFNKSTTNMRISQELRRVFHALNTCCLRVKNQCNKYVYSTRI